MIERLTGAIVHITGIVQGVGFRPFVYGLAKQFRLNGWVRNTSAGVDISVDGIQEEVNEFLFSLEHRNPPLSKIDSLTFEICPPDGYTTFEILKSESIPDAFQPISPDMSICADCLCELFDLNDRRYRYPFINCTNCGPRFTIIKDIPYDRPKTTMQPFKMCTDCSSDYTDPLNRRFHAQPVACHECGPNVWLEFLKKPGRGNQLPDDSEATIRGEMAIYETRKLLQDGFIVAIKGLGGFHLACDATNRNAVTELRNRKLRVDKPFAIMFPDINTVEEHCLISEDERRLITSKERPVVIVYRRENSNISVHNAPNQNTLGVMLPYTSLHYLLLEQISDFPQALVMTSGNLSEEPISTTNSDALDRLASLANAFLMHNREIHVRCDDSVVRGKIRTKNTITIGKKKSRPISKTHKEGVPVHFIRRSRGYAPFPITLPWSVPQILATGGELKNTFCVTKERYALLSQHIGDMGNYETMRSFEEGITHFERLFRFNPEAIVYDLHPNYLSTRYALERSSKENLPAIGVQHHHAHVAACMVENSVDCQVIGVSFDGTGFGDDSAIWGGEFFVADYTNYHRAFHLAYAPLPGGDKTIREPWRMALSWLHQAGLEWAEDLPPVIFSKKLKKHGYLQSEVLKKQLTSGVNTQITSSIGRLFDAVSALIGVRQVINYEAQAAIELEAIIDRRETYGYKFNIQFNDRAGSESAIIDPEPVFHAIIADLRSGLPVKKISSRFHNGLTQMVVDVCDTMRKTFDINVVVLSGGVWQNIYLFDKTVHSLEKKGFIAHTHNKVPANDGGLALGQAAIASQRLLIGNYS